MLTLALLGLFIRIGLAAIKIKIMEFLIGFFGISGLLFWILLIWNIIPEKKYKDNEYEKIMYCGDCHRDTIHVVSDGGFNYHTMCTKCKNFST